ncbi:amidohydrolase family protein [Agromyces soli]
MTDHDAATPLGPLARRVRGSLAGDRPAEPGIALPPFIDHHVHLQMTDPDAPPRGGIAGVVDLGAALPAIAALAERDGLPHVEFAGQFLTAPGGYPGDRWWLRPGSLREVPPVAPGDRSALPDAAAAAVADQAAFGARIVKVVLHADAGPVLDRATVDAIVAAARAHGLLVGVHAEGPGMAALAIEAGADALVHAPFSERLDDGLVARAAAAGQVWISTLAIHERDDDAAFARAVDNLARFRAAGGRVVYGTDLGNGELPGGVNPRELAALVRAGLEASELVTALIDPWPLAAREEWPFTGVTTFVPGDPPPGADGLPDWLATARVTPVEALEPR